MILSHISPRGREELTQTPADPAPAQSAKCLYEATSLSRFPDGPGYLGLLLKPTPVVGYVPVTGCWQFRRFAP
ncbi:hypothetical protein Y032_0022g562 [Ancylostoma ceylanicum]|uniref:Uncharacterized protein n=1 Tax=Ancylostoma ceylanicum TaxID=53326 RepID=A0A016UYN2_9BILA|nr:hypothetical protein Y032_0022g562 [Ancylostoma ceylanicum]